MIQERGLSDHWFPAKNPKKQARVEEYLHWYHANTRLPSAMLIQHLVGLVYTFLKFTSCWLCNACSPFVAKFAASIEKKCKCTFKKNFFFYSIGILKYLIGKYDLHEHWYPRQNLEKQARVEEFLHWQHLNTRFLCASLFQNLVKISVDNKL